MMQNRGNCENKIKTALDELKVTVDENRFEQIGFFYLEKYDITEEKVRLKIISTILLKLLLELKPMDENWVYNSRNGQRNQHMGSKSNHAQMQKW